MKRGALLLFLLGAACGLISYAWLAAASWQPRPSPDMFFGSYALGVLAWVLGLAAVSRGGAPTAAVIVAGIFFRGFMLWSAPLFENDYWRYLWDGRLLLAGCNPYLHAPLDADVAQLRFPGWEQIGYPTVPTCYPPVAELLFTIPWRLGHPGIEGLRLLFLGCEAVLLAALALHLRARGQPMARLLIYLWHPLAIREIAGNAHYEPLPLAFLALSYWLYQRHRGVLGTTALGLSVASKTYALLLAPLWCRLRHWPLLVALVAALYLPFMGDGWHWLDGMRVFATQWRYNGGIFEALRYLLMRIQGFDKPTALAVSRAVMVLVFLALAAFLRLKRSPDHSRTGLLLLTAAGLLSPVFNAWYAVWLLPILTLELVPSATALTLLVTLAYAWHFHHDWADATMAIQSTVVGALWVRDAYCWRM